jgi:sensitive to high expression protein 9
MRPLLQRASRSIFANASFSIPSQSPQSSRAFGRCFTKPASSTPSSCTQYQFRPKPSLSCILSTKQSQRQFSTSRASFEEKKPSNHSEPLRLRTNPPPQDSGPSSINPATHPPPPPSPPSLPPPPSASKIEDTIARTRVQDTVARVPAEDLPSHREGQRWSLSKRLSELMDELLPKLAIVTQKVNTYTGTDYSGIEALRREIKDQGISSGTSSYGKV